MTDPRFDEAPLVAIVPPEPPGDRPAAHDRIGDVWQAGTDGHWWCATRQADTVFAYGRTWPEVVAGFGPMWPITPPVLPALAYTGDLPAQDPHQP